MSLAGNHFPLVCCFVCVCGYVFVLFFLPTLRAKRQPEYLSSASGAGAQGPEGIQKLLSFGAAGPIQSANCFDGWGLGLSESVRNTVLWLDLLLGVIIPARCFSRCACCSPCCRFTVLTAVSCFSRQIIVFSSSMLQPSCRISRTARSAQRHTRTRIGGCVYASFIRSNSSRS